MASPYTISNITDVPLSTTSSLLAGERGRILPEPSRVRIYANRETAAILYNITVGAESAVQDGVSAINATAGDTPSIRDDKIADTFGNAGDEIVIRAANSDGAAAREARVVVFVTPVDDEALQAAMGGFEGAV